MARFLVTGGCGFIGSHLVAHLIKIGHEVLVIDNLSTGQLENLNPNVPVIVADVENIESFRHELACIDGCFHLAAVTSIERAQTEWRNTHLSNQTAFIGLLEAIAERADRSCPVVYASSAAVFGTNGNLPLSEASATFPISAYGADKLGCELHARIGGIEHNLPTAGLRFFNVYGPRQYPATPYSGVVSIFARRALDGKSITIFGNGEQSRDFIYVADVVTALTAAISVANTGGLLINVCQGRQVTINRLAETIACLMEHEVQIDYLPARSGDVTHSLGDPRKMHELLGVQPSIDLTTGLSLTLDWMRLSRADN